MATAIGIWDALSPEAQAKVSGEVVEWPIEQPDEIDNTTTRISFETSASDGSPNLAQVVAKIFEREDSENVPKNTTGSESSVVGNSGHDGDDWENISACSTSNGVPLSKQEIHRIFGGIDPLDIFRNGDSDDGHDFIYQGRSLHVQRLNNYT